MDFLIFRRSLRLIADDPSIANKAGIALSMSNQHYMQAIKELMEWPVVEMEPAERLLPYYNPFGTGGHENRGYRSPKYPSNGPSVTARGTGFSKITTLSGTNPSVLSFKPDYQENLPAILLKAGGGPLPILADVGVWYHRAADLSEYAETSPAQLLARLASTTTDALGLSSEEVALLFDRALPDEGADAE
jgi:hypothetical protein